MNRLQQAAEEYAELVAEGLEAAGIYTAAEIEAIFQEEVELYKMRVRQCWQCGDFDD